MKTKFQRGLLTAILALWAIASLMFMCAEDTPGEEINLTTFIAVKIIALASFAICVRTGQYIHRKYN